MVKNCDGQTVRQTRTGYREAGVTVLRPQPRTYKYLLILALDGWHSYLLISTKVSPTVRTFKNTLHSKPSLHPIHEALLFHSIHEVTQSQVSTESSELALPQSYSLVANGVRELTQGFAVQWSCIYPLLLLSWLIRRWYWVWNAHPIVLLAGKIKPLVWILNGPALISSVVMHVLKVTIALTVQQKNAACKWTFQLHKHIYCVSCFPQFCHSHCVYCILTNKAFENSCKTSKNDCGRFGPCWCGEGSNTVGDKWCNNGCKP